MKATHLLPLRNGQPLNLFDTVDKLFVKFQLNKAEKFVCWKRYVSKDRRNWVCWNEFLSLSDVDRAINRMISRRNELSKESNI